MTYTEIFRTVVIVVLVIQYLFILFNYKKIKNLKKEIRDIKPKVKPYKSDEEL